MPRRKTPRHLGLAVRLREARAEKQISLRALAELAGVSHTTVRSIETSKHRICSDVIEQLAEALQVSPAWLAYGMGEREAKE